MVGWVEDVAVEGEGEELTEHVAAEEVFDNGEGGRESRGDAEGGADGEDAGEEELGERLDGEAEEGVDEGPGEDACEAEGVLPRVGVLLGEGQGGGAEGLEGGAGGGEEGVESEK